MNDLQKLGDAAALIEAPAYAIGFVGVLTLFTPYFIGDELDAVGRVAFIVNQLALMQAWYLVLYVVFGVFLVLLVQISGRTVRGASPFSTPRTAS